MGAFTKVDQLTFICCCIGLAHLIHRYTKQGYDQDYVFHYPDVLRTVSLEHVREAVNKCIDLEKCLAVAVGELGDF